MKLSKIMWILLMTGTMFVGRGVCNDQVLEKNVDFKAFAEVRKSQADFALDVFRLGTESQEDQNVVFSPWGIYRMLGALRLGADGKTREEIASAMKFPGDDSEWSEGTAIFSSLLGKSGALQTADALWFNDRYQLGPEYGESLQKISALEIKTINLRTPDLQKEAVQKVNAWFEEKTQGRIKDLVDELDSDTGLVLTDAIHFNAQWESVFYPEDNKGGIFTNIKGEKKHIRYMCQEEDYKYVNKDGIEYLQLPYADSQRLDSDEKNWDEKELKLPYVHNQFSMVILLPENNEKFKKMKESLTAKSLDQFRKEADRQKIDLRLPPWQEERKEDLESLLKKLGIVEAWNIDSADFSKIPLRNTQQLLVPLYLKKAQQGVFIKVSEKGTEAAAGTYISPECGATPDEPEPVIVNVNRPFLYFIRHNKTNAILFIGQVVDLPEVPADSNVPENKDKSGHSYRDSVFPFNFSPSPVYP